MKEQEAVVAALLLTISSSQKKRLSQGKLYSRQSNEDE